MCQRRKQNLTVSLRAETIQKARIVAAKRSTSISGLITEQLESLVGADQAYESTLRVAISHLDKGFHLGGRRPATRDELHER